MYGGQAITVARLTRVLVAAGAAGAITEASRRICVTASARAGGRARVCAALHTADKVLGRSAR